MSSSENPTVELPQTITTLPVPLVIPILGGMKLGKTIEINGTFNTSATSVTISLAAGPGEKDNIVLEMDIVFDPDGVDNTVTLSTKAASGQETSIPQPNFPFKPSNDYKIKISAFRGQFQIDVGGSLYTTYKYVLNLGDAIYLKVKGDTILSQVVF